MKSFSDFILIKEGKKFKSEEEKKAYNDFVSGKVDTLKLSSGGPIARGHQTHLGGAGTHDSRPKRERTRSDQKRSWKKEYE